jgi:bifunctional DNA-binding transcriptional regulator/antitoxin component of YhaV-PrlF toxin-antitoxin module
MYKKKELYAIQPYLIGSKSGQSLALIIPAQVRKEANLDASTVFVLKIDQKTRRVVLQNIDEKFGNLIPADDSFASSKQ